MPIEPTAQPALLSAPGAPAPLPLIAVDVGADGLADNVRDAALERLLGMGLARPGRSLLPAAPTPAPGWHARLGGGRLLLTGPAEHVLYDGHMAAWPALARAVADLGGAVLAAGHIDLHLGADVIAAVHRAAAAEQAVVGLVAATVTV
ncbi:hypothetical protein [Nocardiopsis baichengensis]|uniref:hypothetical protein n=1 Tax=Nocardiopsis baichengensis TaxID=280240 RepID=UPI00034C7F06|nr:hypothetical protein [Nocardiopsis baichengensis]